MALYMGLFSSIQLGVPLSINLKIYIFQFWIKILNYFSGNLPLFSLLRAPTIQMLGLLD